MPTTYLLSLIKEDNVKDSFETGTVTFSTDVHFTALHKFELKKDISAEKMWKLLSTRNFKPMLYEKLTK